ncbi:hypothetical protein PRIPAC_95133 [Pristionchus pacificus]|uniref:Peptidase n=1 Tax=Pristionchus pacificus TaxID=54126 RepID=A0A2A6CGZ6_PRIPA|nr:hypothetical protein PRIPAC_95133 [Pristionchus pacificus]|eukprot:PDM77482.1 Peptidase [Pristionchus pacificus]
MIGMNLLAIAALLTVALAIPSMFSGRPKGGFTSHLFNNQYFFNYEFANEDSNVNILFIAGEVSNIAEFIRQKNEEKKEEQKWIVVGGSYAGALSAWSRLIHPELIVGSLSSSAPLLAQMDFYGYLQTVEEDLKKIGGPCHDQTFTVHGPDYDPVKALKTVNPYLTMNINFTDTVLELSGVGFEGDTSSRLWLYQTCNEFGFFHSSDRGTSVFGQTQPSKFIDYWKN